LLCSQGRPIPHWRPSTSTISEIGADSGFLEWVKSEPNASPDFVVTMDGEFDDLDQAPELRHWIISSMQAHFDVAATAPPQVVRVGAAKGSEFRDSSRTLAAQKRGPEPHN
jgi:hypothetical protein